MKVLLDECVPIGMKIRLAEHGIASDSVRTAGFGSKKNGELLSLAEGKWDVLLTTDKNLRYQQNLAGRNIAVVIIRAKTNRLQDLEPHVMACVEALQAIRPGQISEIGSQ
jgi:predicted nuclease of predicted toxin-antitoxin system